MRNEPTHDGYDDPTGRGLTVSFVLPGRDLVDRIVPSTCGSSQTVKAAVCGVSGVSTDAARRLLPISKDRQTSSTLTPLSEKLFVRRDATSVLLLMRENGVGTNAGSARRRRRTAILRIHKMPQG